MPGPGGRASFVSTGDRGRHCAETQDRQLAAFPGGATGLHVCPIIKKVSPSVVNLYTAKTVRENFQTSPLFNDPFFRDFFVGMPFGQRMVPRERREQVLGFGVIVTEDGYIFTTNHIVDGADEIKVALADDKTSCTAKVVGTDPQTDIAVIRVEGKNLPAITATGSDNLGVGDVVLAIGNPFGVAKRSRGASWTAAPLPARAPSRPGPRKGWHRPAVSDELRTIAGAGGALNLMALASGGMRGRGLPEVTQSTGRSNTPVCWKPLSTTRALSGSSFQAGRSSRCRPAMKA